MAVANGTHGLHRAKTVNELVRLPGVFGFTKCWTSQKKGSIISPMIFQMLKSSSIRDLVAIERTHTDRGGEILLSGVAISISMCPTSRMKIAAIAVGYDVQATDAERVRAHIKRSVDARTISDYTGSSEVR